MGLSYNTYLNSSKIYGCKGCKTHLANHDDIISRVSLKCLSSFAARYAPVLLWLAVQPKRRINRCYRRSGMFADYSSSSAQSFHGQHGKAYLFHNVVNVDTGERMERNMTTGRHVVFDITCRQCSTVVGWKYDRAYESSQKYKEGKFILEAELLCNVT